MSGYPHLRLKEFLYIFIEINLFMLMLKYFIANAS